MVKIEISNRVFILLGVLFVIIIGGGVLLAVDNPAVFGHSLAQVAMPDCNEGDVLMKKNGAWSCGTVTSSNNDPDYDSGWFLVNKDTDKEISKAHNLGTVPKSVSILICKSLSGNDCVGKVIYADYRWYIYFNPVLVAADSSNIYLPIWPGAWAYTYYTQNTDWTAHSTTAYYRIYAWK